MADLPILTRLPSLIRLVRRAVLRRSILLAVQTRYMIFIAMSQQENQIKI